MKSIFIQHAARRVFTVGDCILALLLLVTSPFQVKFSGPYEVPKRLFELNYIISTPDYRKETQLCHVDLLKPYFHQVTSEPGVVEQSSMGGGHPVCSVGRVSTTPKVVAAEVEVGLPDLDPFPVRQRFDWVNPEKRRYSMWMPRLITCCKTVMLNP